MAWQMIVLYLLVLQPFHASARCSTCYEGWHLRTYSGFVTGEDGTWANCEDTWNYISMPELDSFPESCEGRPRNCWETCEAFHQLTLVLSCCEQTVSDTCWIQTGFDHSPNLFTDGDVQKLAALIAESGCAEVMADSLQISNAVSSLKGLEKLVHVGRLMIFHTGYMTDLQGLDGLKTVGELIVHDNFVLSSLRGLRSLRFACTLQVFGNMLLTSMEGLDGLQSLGGCVVNEPLPTTSNSKRFLSHVSVPSTKVPNALVLEKNNAMTSLYGLGALETVEGSITIENNEQLESLSGLDALVSVTGGNDLDAVAYVGLGVTNNPMLTSLQGLHNLKILEFNLVIHMNDALLSIEALDSITNHDSLRIAFIKENKVLCMTAEQRIFFDTKGGDLQECSCVPGRFPDDNVCRSCPAGSFCIGGQAQAQLCPNGSTASGGSTECKCTKGFEPHATTQDHLCRKCQEFSSSAGDSGPCFCDNRAHGVEDYFGDGSTCSCPQQSFMSKLSQRCGPCNEGEECNWDLAHARSGLSLRPPLIKPGYWAEMVTDEAIFSGHSIWRCYSAKTCIGNSTCAAHRTGMLCGDCLPGFYGGPDGPCLECELPPANHRALLACIMIGITLATLLLLQCVGILRAREGKHGISTTKVKMRECSRNIKSVVRSAKQVIKFFQTLGVVYTFHIQWPDGVREIFDFLKKFSFSIDGALQEHCMTDNPSVELLVYYKCLVPVVVLFMVMAYVPLAHALALAVRKAPCARLRQLARAAPSAASDACQLAFQFFSVFFISILIAVGSAFRCRDNPNGIWVVQEHPQLECFADQWMQLLPVLAASVFFYVMCYVIALICIVRQCCQSLLKSDGKSRGNFGFVVEDFRTTQIFFGVVVVIKDVAVNAISLLPVDPSIQLSTAIAVLALYVFAVVKEKPFEDPMSNHLETLLHAILILLITFMGSTGFFSERNTKAESFFISLLMVTLVPIAAMFLLQVFLAIPCLAVQVPQMFKPLSKEHWQKDLTQVFEAIDYAAWKTLLRELDPVDRARASNVLTWNVQLNADGILRPRGSRILLSPWEWPIHRTSKQPLSNADVVSRQDDEEVEATSGGASNHETISDHIAPIMPVMQDNQEVDAISSDSQITPPIKAAGQQHCEVDWDDVLKDPGPDTHDFQKIFL